MDDQEEPTRQDEQTARIAHALGHPIRVAIVRVLARGETCSCELAPRFALDQSGVSRHLAVLRRAGLIVSRRDGVRRLHRLATPDVLRLVALAQTLTDRPEPRSP